MPSRLASRSFAAILLSMFLAGCSKDCGGGSRTESTAADATKLGETFSALGKVEVVSGDGTELEMTLGPAPRVIVQDLAAGEDGGHARESFMVGLLKSTPHEGEPAKDGTKHVDLEHRMQPAVIYFGDQAAAAHAAWLVGYAKWDAALDDAELDRIATGNLDASSAPTVGAPTPAPLRVHGHVAPYRTAVAKTPALASPRVMRFLCFGHDRCEEETLSKFVVLVVDR
ncbi:hypothetical protein AKJ09_11270 [Labilithrix luteola]|uniref:Lipoprotein n=1 Tax=Labilithrix luteola TaxID=1391654 RepID=A0A0K1QG14_9BACT|nr:hypothetical protein [Labilithrix luteola]AKV04607.1 hypothetical protein AKJ09_11270 [Labilithrix luteola]